jgi:hypothetical protein
MSRPFLNRHTDNSEAAQIYAGEVWTIRLMIVNTLALPIVIGGARAVFKEVVGEGSHFVCTMDTLITYRCATGAQRAFTHTRTICIGLYQFTS